MEQKKLEVMRIMNKVFLYIFDSYYLKPITVLHSDSDLKTLNRLRLYFELKNIERNQLLMKEEYIGDYV